jgi:hypothetical protein
MENADLKTKVLQEIMDLMDQKEGDALKSHPKLMAAKIEVAKPEDSAEALKEKLLGDKGEEELGHEASESPDVEAKESAEISPEDLQKLLEHFKGL